MVEDDREDAADVQAHRAYYRGDSATALNVIRTFMPDGFDAKPGDSCFVACSSLIRLAARIALDSGDATEAQAWLRTHDHWIEWSGSVLGRADGTLGWARCFWIAGEVEKSERYARQALNEASEPRQPLTLLTVHRFIGEIDASQGRHDEAWDALKLSLEIARQCEAPYEEALTMLAMARLHVGTGKPDPARRLILRVRSICTSLQAGPALERADKIEQAIPAKQVGLTPREVDVLRLVARGTTDAEAAAELFISPRTVGQHLRSIYNKLGVNNRTEAAHLATRRKLI